MIYGLTIFLSAFLLFQVQLISAKQLLPWFGGAPAVWTTCQVFFQIALLGGYAYAHFSTRRLRPQRQVVVHLSLLLAAALALAVSTGLGGIPLLAPQSLKPHGTELPIPLLLVTLLGTVGLPFFVLSATGPLLQSWHSRSAGSLDRTYRLYALSNVGSLLGLISYPFAIERLFDLNIQAWGWSALFICFALGCGTIAWASRALPANAPSSDSLPGPNRLEEGDVHSGTHRWLPWIWLLLSFTSSALFLSLTNQLSQEVAVVPFLWVMPLAVYLATYIVCFDRPKWYSRQWCSAGAMAASLAVVLKPAAATIPIVAQVVVYGIFLALFCMVCHGELVRVRPSSEKLTLYYLLIAAGGAAGGAFVSLVAPALFSGLWELYVAILVGWLVVAFVWLKDHESPFWKGGRAFFALSVVLMSLAVVPFLLVGTPLRRAGWVVHNPWAAVLAGAGMLSLVGFVCGWNSLWARRPAWPRALLAITAGIAVVFLVRRVGETRAGTVFAARNFFGIVRVVAVKARLTDETGAYKLIHGVTDHGLQFTDPQWRSFPTTYYSPSSGIGVAVRSLALRGGTGVAGRRRPLNIGVLGLGVGTIAAYARKGDLIRFYEIDPIVIALASKGSPYFTFLGDCAVTPTIVQGDARLSLEREFSEGNHLKFDLLVVDAFSGDAIPVHLLTSEAFRLYAAHLRGSDSILAIHVSNAYLDLEPVVAAGAREIGFQGVRIDSAGADSQLPEPSTWILLAHDPDVLRLTPSIGSTSRALSKRAILFTDQYSNLFRVLK